MLDLNHGSKKPPKLANIFNQLIDEALEKERSRQPERQYIGMSEIADECSRRVFYRVMGAPHRPLTGARLRIFETGHQFEAMIAWWLRQAGFDLETHDERTGQQYAVSTAEGVIQGHIDGVFAGGPPLPGLTYPALWECKALKAKGWKPIVKSGLRIAEPKYYGQVQLYMAYHDLLNCLFTAINKDTEEIYPEIIPFDLQSAQEFSDRGVSIVQACRADQPPPRICPSASFFQAKWCEFAPFCFGDER